MNTQTEIQERISFGVAWYRPQQWQRIRDISTDSDALNDSYEEWLIAAEAYVEEISVTGVHVEKVDVDSEQLILWCNTYDMELNANARSQYVVEKLREMDEARQSPL